MFQKKLIKFKGCKKMMQFIPYQLFFIIQKYLLTFLQNYINILNHTIFFKPKEIEQVLMSAFYGKYWHILIYQLITKAKKDLNNLKCFSYNVILIYNLIIIQTILKMILPSNKILLGTTL